MVMNKVDSTTMKQLYTTPSEGKRGRLRIYFGYAAGVGKTCAMLNDAHIAQSDGIDVVAGYIEPHDRPETMALLEGLESLPPLEVSYKGINLREFDIDSALKRRPSLILVDELAHTNASVCRHKKRYQDVEELLKAGIDVYTTINVQHIESLNDIVESITGICVRERIPDSVFDKADQIELVDIEPGDLIDRLNKGKVYKEGQAQRALENFFTKEKLIALREIALRRTADQINRIAIQNELNNDLHVNEHILVCISSAPSNARVIRTAARMAEAFHGTFTALFVETPETKDLEDKSKGTLRDNLRLAEQLGAQILTVYGEDVPEQIAEYAKISRVSKIVMGRSSRLKRWWRPNFIDRLTELAPTIDIYIIPDVQSSSKIHSPKINRSFSLSAEDTFKSIGILLICTLIGVLFNYNNFSVSNIIIVYILGVQLSAVVTKGRIYSVVSSFLSVVTFNYLFTEPRYSLLAFDIGYPVTFLIMLSAALITSTLTKQIKDQALQSARKAYRTEVLLETSQKLQKAKDKDAILSEAAHQIVKLLDKTIIIYPTNENSLGEPKIFPAENTQSNLQLYFETQERAVAEWVFVNNKRAGATSNTLSGARCLYLAVRGGGESLAVVGVAMDNNLPLESFEKSIFIAILGECALALEKQILSEEQQKISMQMQQEKLRANLLRAISHDLRTPLTSISGNAGILMGNAKVLSEEQKKGLYTDIYDDSIWLINLVENLLSITRIDNGTLNLNMQPDLLDEIISESLRHINRDSVNHNIKTVLSDDFLMAKMDSQLIVQVIVNIIDNAIKYTHKGSNIIITAKKDESLIRVEVADDGGGISEESKEKLFDMFYTADNIHGDGRRGLGLGLSLCKSIILAHGGNIYVEDNVPKGTIVGFTLSAEEVNLYE